MRQSLDRTLAQSKADWIVNGAAYTAVDLAEEEPARAAAINDAAVGILAAAAARARARLLHLSTDFVFDGAANRAYLPSDLPNPLSVYGATKLAGEKKALDGECAAIVLRTAWVYAAAGKNFVLTMLKLMREREQVRVVGDQIGTPTWATGIALRHPRLARGRGARGCLSLDRSRRGELVRLCGGDSRRGARAGSTEARGSDRADCDFRISDAGARDRPSACSTPRRRAPLSRRPRCIGATT